MASSIMLPAAAVALLLAIHGQSLAQSQTKLVCWAQSPNMCPGDWHSPTTEFIACGTAGFSGFNPNYVCSKVCGVPLGVRCRITPGPGGPGGQCGYRAAKVDCFDQP
jgi:hypothetical protein